MLKKNLKHRSILNHQNSFQNENNFVVDEFSHNPSVTICNLIVVVIFLGFMLIPFILIGRAIWIYHDYRLISLVRYMFQFCVKWFIFFLITIPILTIFNNHRIYKKYHGKTTYNHKVFKARNQWLQSYYTSKYGLNRQDQKIYTVDKTNNIPIDYIIKLHRKMMRGKN